MGILSKSTIDTWIIPHLTVGSRGFDPTVPIHEIIRAILHRLITGCNRSGAVIFLVKMAVMQ
jgi:hypothetical protein